MSRRVIVKLMGGLGNQMLQYATALSLAKKLKAKLWLDVNYFRIDTKLNNTHREFELSVFNVQHPHYSGMLSNYLLNKVILKSRLIRQQVLPLGGFLYYTDRDNLLAVQDQRMSFSYYLDGYWTSLHYFDTCRNELLEVFDMSSSIGEENQSIADAIEQQNSVGVHVRRTDYMLPNSSHKVLPLEYYQRAIETIRSDHDDCVFYFFGDDYDWIKSNFPIDQENYVLVDQNKGRHAYVDMTLMSKCKHLIISNSTFSWWAAYLNQQGGVLIAPDQWFLPGKSPYFVYDNFIPAEWRKVKA